MAKICVKCQRVNPADAVYCHFDGQMLAGGGNGAALAVGAQAFRQPFYFPSGRTCRTFDELAIACDALWPDALEMLRHGDLANFLGGLGRGDLAQAAREAAVLPDRDRGLDRLLARLPSNAVTCPRLKVEPSRLNLGQMKPGQDRRLELRLVNQGQRLLYGSVTSDCPWLSPGEKAGLNRKLFQFRDDLVLPVHVHGQSLRASQQPLEGRLLFDTNGGQVQVPIRVEVPIKPYPEGIFAGATAPRQVAEKARDQPHQAASQFENGGVARWYKDNGWDYPVKGPTSSGLGAIQQFFEALGLAAPPRVTVSERSVQLRGQPGARLEHFLEVRTEEKRAVWALAASDQPWLEVGRAQLQLQSARVPLVVPAAPRRPGETLHAQVAVTANGNQRFVVPVTLMIEGVAAPPRTVLPPMPPAPPMSAPPVRVLHAGPPPDVVPVLEEKKRSPWRHLLPIGVMALALLTVVIHDLLVPAQSEQGSLAASDVIDPTPVLEVQFHDRNIPVELVTDGGWKTRPGERAQRGITGQWEPSMRFGLRFADPADPHRFKKLTFEENGTTNNTVVRVDGRDHPFGDIPVKWEGRPEQPSPARWVEREAALGKASTGRTRDGRRSVWAYDREKIQITQTVEIVGGEQSRRLDTCLVHYRIDNKDKQPHLVGLRFMLDTYIGANDGVPFTIPGEQQLCDTLKDFPTPERVPDFIQALEREDLANPGTIAQVQLRLGPKLDPPDRVTLGAWPDPELRDRDPRCMQARTGWEVPLLPIKSRPPGDSCVVIYWKEKDLPAGASREMAFAYGLGTVSSGEGGGKLGLSVGGSFRPGGEFTVTALVSRPAPGETVTLELPSGFKLQEGEATQPVPPIPAGAVNRNSPVTWKVIAGRAGTYSLKVKSSTGAAQAQPVTIKTRGIFD